MKSRAITLGASVIALALGGTGLAEAAVVGDVGQLPQIGVAPKVEANIKANVKTDIRTPVLPHSKRSLQADARGSDHPRTTVEAKGQSGKDTSHVVLDWSTRHDLSAYADQRRKGKLELEGQGSAGSRHAESSAAGFARHLGEARLGGSAGIAKPKRLRDDRRIRDHSPKVPAAKVLRPVGHDKHLTPLQGIGREVGNPIQLSLAAWLIGLTGAGSLGVSRLVRRFNRVD